MTSTQHPVSAAALVEQVRALVESVVMRRLDADTLLIESALVDSVLAVEIALRVETAFGVQVPPTELGEHLASVAALAAYVADNTTHR